MLLKLMSCQVEEQTKKNFAQAQEAWHRLSDVKGFTCQLGGWTIENPYEACIIGLWEDKDSYKEFMLTLHDQIYLESKQKDTFKSLAIEMAEINVRLDYAHLATVLGFKLISQPLNIAEGLHLKTNRGNHYVLKWLTGSQDTGDKRNVGLAENSISKSKHKTVMLLDRWTVIRKQE